MFLSVGTPDSVRMRAIARALSDGEAPPPMRIKSAGQSSDRTDLLTSAVLDYTLPFTVVSPSRSCTFSTALGTLQPYEEVLIIHTFQV